MTHCKNCPCIAFSKLFPNWAKTNVGCRSRLVQGLTLALAQNDYEYFKITLRTKSRARMVRLS